MDEKRVVLELTAKEVGWACGRCGNFWSNRHFGGAPEAAKQIAQECCQPRRCACGNPCSSPSHIACTDCFGKASKEREDKRFEAAKKIPSSSYEGEMVYQDGHGREGYMLVDYASDEVLDGSMVPWAWACTEMKLHLDAQDIVESELENQNFYDGAYGDIPSGMLVELQQFLDDWCNRTRLTGYMQDESTVVTFVQI